MMDRMEAAARRYTAICPEGGTELSPSQAAQVSAWLDQDVCPVVEELLVRPIFCNRAAWPIRYLGAGAHGEERRLVEAVDTALLNTAAALVGFARQGKNLAALRRLGPYQEVLPRGSLDGTEPGILGKAGKRVPLGLSVVESIATRPWKDLVAVQDYFHPVAELNLISAGDQGGEDRERLATFTPAFNPRLQAPGDYVSRTMMLRIEHWTLQLQKFTVRCHSVFRRGSAAGGPAWAAVGRAWQELNAGVEALRALCCSGDEARIRNSCIALVQVYAGYRPRADLSWLKLPPKIARNASGIRHRVEQRRDAGFVERIAAALADVTPIYRRPLEPEEMIGGARQRYALLLVGGVGARQAFWKGKRIPAAWTDHAALWDFLWTIAERALKLQGMDGFGNDEERAAALKDRKHRLGKIVPRDLFEKIRPAGRGTYRLEIRPDDICLLQNRDQDSFVALTSI